MAVQGDKDEEGNVKTAPGVEHNTAQMRAPGPGFTGSGLSELRNTLGTASSLGGAIEEYLKNIMSYFGNDTSPGLIKIDKHRLTEPTGAHAFVSGKHAILMMFTETLPADSQNFIPASDYGAYAVRALKSKFGDDIKLVNLLVVQPGDYVRAQQMARYIAVSLAVATNTKIADTTIAVMGDSNYSIDPDVVAARSYINNLNPSSVMPRIDIGFVIYEKPARRPGSQLGLLENMNPVAAVGGYTEILAWRDQTGMIKYLPLVHITAIASDIPLPGIVPLCVTIAADQFISTGRWVQQFATFQKGKPNLGQLFPDPSDPKKLWFTANHSDLDQLRAAHFLPAVLAVDVVEGQARIPTLAAYGYLPNAGAVYDQIQSFFGGRIPLDRTHSPYDIRATDFIGVYGDRSGTLLDSRNIDYLTLLAEGSQDAAAQSLLGYPMEPAGRARVISEKTGGSFKSLYRLTVSTLNPVLLATLAQAVTQTLGIEAPAGQNRMTPTDWMRASSQSYQQQNFGVTRTDTRMGFGIGGSYNV